MRIRIALFSALFVLSTLCAGTAFACPGSAASKVEKNFRIVKAAASEVVVHVTTQQGADAVTRLQKHFTEKVLKYNLGKAPCARCPSANCLFKIQGLKLQLKKHKLGVELIASGRPEVLKTFTKTVRAASVKPKAKRGQPASSPVFKPSGSGCGCAHARKTEPSCGGESNTFKTP